MVVYRGLGGSPINATIHRFTYLAVGHPSCFQGKTLSNNFTTKKIRYKGTYILYIVSLFTISNCLDRYKAGIKSPAVRNVCSRYSHYHCPPALYRYRYC